MVDGSIFAVLCELLSAELDGLTFFQTGKGDCGPVSGEVT